MNIQITIADEDRLVAIFKQHLLYEARRAVAESPDRVGKQFARVTMPDIQFRSLYWDCQPRIEWV